MVAGYERRGAAPARRSELRRMTLALLTSAVLIAALGSLTVAPLRRASLQPVRVMHPRAQVTPGGSGAAYFTVRNASGVDDRLLSVHPENARRAELHEIEEERGVVKMKPRPGGFSLRTGDDLRLSPGGKHVMIYGVAKDARELRITLRFERGGEVPVTVPVMAEVHADDPDL